MSKFTADELIDVLARVPPSYRVEIVDESAYWDSRVRDDLEFEVDDREKLVRIRANCS